MKMLLLLLLPLLLSLPFTLSAAIEDNSFLLEEAFNQERGEYQFIQKYRSFHEAKGYEYIFENELPITDEKHQFSYEIPYFRGNSDDRSALGDVTLSYRWQPLNRNGVLMAERLGLILPTGRVDQNAGHGVLGFEFMQAASIRM